MNYHNVELMRAAESGTEAFWDAICWPEFRHWVELAAERLEADYCLVRQRVMEYHTRDYFFHLAALAEFVATSDSSAVSGL